MKSLYIFVLLTFLFSTGLYAYEEHRMMHKGKTEIQDEAGICKEIKLEAFQYGFSPDPAVVKKGDIVKLDITSRDVTHGVRIKGYNINAAVKKDEHKKIEFFADKAGKFDIICSVYCGSGHSKMRGTLVVEE